MLLEIKESAHYDIFLEMKSELTEDKDAKHSMSTAITMTMFLLLK